MTTRKTSPRRLWLLRLLLVAASLSFTVVTFEIALRLFPAVWPTGSYGAGRFSPELHLRVHAAPAIYNKVRWSRRVANREGFLDAEHAREKPAGVTRVGFFGDSYVEAVQVPLEQTFYRKLPAEIAERAIEPLAFGISGWGTYHSLMAYRVLGPRYDLDHVIYFFVKNDPGDQYFRLQFERRGRVTVKPSLELTDGDPGYTVKMLEYEQEPFLIRTRRFIERKSLVVRLLRVRLALLLMSDDDDSRDAPPARDTGEPQKRRMPGENAYPSQWPAEFLEEAQLITWRVLKQFRDEVTQDGRRFSVLYVPRGIPELEGGLSHEDTWFPWLSRSCAELGIPLLDPRDSLARKQRAGVAVYDDHWTPAGHEIIAAVIGEHLEREPGTD